MHHLELLIIENVHLLHDPKHLPDSLRVLIWNGYSSKSFPSSLHLKTFKRMKFIQFTKSQKLIETLDFNKVPILEKLVLEDCINLRGVHPSIGVHKKLIHLCIKGCRNLKSLPTKLEMESLETLIISGCLKIKKIPDFGENMRHVLKLYLDELAITKLPTSIGHLTSLALLNIKDCKSLTCLPSNIFNLKMLKEISITGCSKLEGLPEILRKAESVEELDVSGTTIKEVPSSSGLLKNLMLSFRECKSTSWYDLLPFYSRPKSPNPVGLSSLSGLCSLTKLNLSDCNLRAIPNDIGCLFSLEEIDLEGNSFVCLPDSISQLWIAVCAVFCSLPHLQKGHCSLFCQLIMNGNKLNSSPQIELEVGSSENVWLLYLLNQYYNELEDIKLLKECDANEFNQIGIKIVTNSNVAVKKCGFHMVCKKDMEDLNQTMARSSNINIIPYEDLSVLHHNFNNSVVVGEGNIAKRTCDDYDGSGPSGEGSSSDMPNPKRIERVPEFKTHGNSDCTESSE
nr:tmv resistance protein n [Quercus suber]